MQQLQSYWYTWGALVAFIIALMTTFGVFFDAQRKQVDAVLWKMLTVLAAVLVFPSVVLSVIGTLQPLLAPALLPLMFLGIAALVVAVVALPLYALGVGVPRGNRCPNCNQPRDPSWPYCPYCEYDKPAAVPPAAIPPPTPVYQPPTPIAPLPPTPAYQPPTPIAPAPPVAPQDKTVALDALGNPIVQPAQTPQAPATRILKAAPPTLAYLVVKSGTHQGKTFQLSESTSIGRKGDVNDIVLDDDAVSRQHARVRLEGSKFVLTDLGSSNGTFVRDAESGDWKKIQQRQLTDGLNIKIGETILVFMQIKSDKEG